MTLSTPNLQLSHVDQHGKAHMVDVTEKQQTVRQATAEGYLSLSADSLQQVQNNQVIKGDVFSVARIAGIQGAKNCANLIPLCHPLLLTKIHIDFEIDNENSQIRVLCLCKLTGNTGVEMEALTGVTIAALTLFDMCKALDPSMTIHTVRVLTKQGGKTGPWTRAIT
ncbi:cyclic pyranopterin monophosphate synthase MoaC [uncultured Paraglaciecola sp.]|uniref:cyclic pyranopterin monophosphate synthase MoaC n=1 Tax=uncultured Paraglaciecola sp. TaxID=1765024 RepID=UPI0025E1DB12|nr:cyclic pyranopterin monophosphate synthase MoaC [uncultured Paraglaciecola sp.]